MKYIILLLFLVLLLPLTTSAYENSDIILSRGDGIYATGSVPSDGGDRAWVWIFTNTRNNIDTRYDKYFGIPIIINDGIYTIDISSNNISDLKAGSYDVLIQFEGQNNIREIYYDKNTTELVSVYKDIDNIKIGGSVQAVIAENYLISMMTNRTNGLPDDTYEIRQLTVEDPYIRITELYPSPGYDNVMKIKGVTNLNQKHWIYMYYDENVNSKRGTMVIDGDKPGENVFEYDLSVPINSMSTGQHFITAKSDLGLYTTASFNVGEQFPIIVSVTPTPYKYIYPNSNNGVYPLATEPTPTPQIIYVTVVITPEPTPIIIPTTLPTPTPTPPGILDNLSTNDIIPIVLIGLLAVGVLFIKRRQPPKKPKEEPDNDDLESLQDVTIEGGEGRKEETVVEIIKKPKKPKSLLNEDFEFSR